MQTLANRELGTVWRHSSMMPNMADWRSYIKPASLQGNISGMEMGIIKLRFVYMADEED